MSALPTAFSIRDVRIFPNVVLAPMEGVTDLGFRRLIRSIGGAGLTCTEFVPSSSLAGVKDEGRAFEMAAFDPDERPVSIQIYGRDPDIMAEAARVVQGLGATICDINMGCPSKKVCKNSGGSALMRDLDLATAIVAKVRKAITIPLTVKMRSGFDGEDRNGAELAWRCQEEGAEAITIHWRTRADLYGGQRQVDVIAAAKARLKVPLIGNGDVIDPASAEAMMRETGCDGVMVGRGAMRNPWSLLQISQHLQGLPLTRPEPMEKRRVLLGFLESLRPGFKSERGALGRFKKVANHFTAGLPHGTELLRASVLRSQDIDEAVTHVDAYFALYARWADGDGSAFEAALAAA